MSVPNACGFVTISHSNPHNLDQSFVIFVVVVIVIIIIIIIIIIIKGMPEATGI
jgi:hypothetical protein